MIMKKQFLSIITLVIIFLAFGCTGKYENGKELASESLLYIQQISVDSLKATLASESEFHLIDVRQPEEYNRGYINLDFDYNFYTVPVNIPRGKLEFVIDDPGFWEDYYEDVPDKDTTEIIIYCGDGNKGALATECLMQLGYKNVRNLQGGFNAFNPDQKGTVEPKEEGGCGG